MDYLAGLIAWAVQVIMDLIQATGYPGIVMLMALESMCLPVPSEVVLPFAGALVSLGRLSITGDTLIDSLLVAVAGTIGCTIGSTLAYLVGLKGGRPFIIKYGRYVRMNEKHLDLAECWFHKYGDWAVFGSRLLPVVRTFISLPAGIARMPFKRFVLLSAVGSLPWCLLLTYIGVVLGDNWESVEALYRPFEIIVVIGIAALIVYYVWRWRTSKKVCSP
ncbi:MAG: DedA family protein [Methanomassiliicoccus sp.]|nr:DedA family protein [Methanomassiliicoccus sp.]